MTHREVLEGLLARVEKATGPDEDLDSALAYALGDSHLWREGDGGSEPLPFTGSVDAALVLVKRLLPRLL